MVIWLLGQLTEIHLALCGGGLVAKLCPTLVTQWTVTHQAPLSMGFSRQEYQSGISSSRGSSQPRDWTQVSWTAGKFFTNWAIREKLIFIGALLLYNVALVPIVLIYTWF